MPSSEHKIRFTMVLFMSALSLKAATANVPSHSTHVAINIPSESIEDLMSVGESLKKDIADHPNDFITFETYTGANRFISGHSDEIYRETDRRVLQRGILGYWRGKTLVIFPALSIATEW